jgi:hypothetical protein
MDESPWAGSVVGGRSSGEVEMDINGDGYIWGPGMRLSIASHASMMR